MAKKPPKRPSEITRSGNREDAGIRGASCEITPDEGVERVLRAWTKLGELLTYTYVAPSNRSGEDVPSSARERLFEFVGDRVADAIRRGESTTRVAEADIQPWMSSENFSQTLSLWKQGTSSDPKKKKDASVPHRGGTLRVAHTDGNGATVRVLSPKEYEPGVAQIEIALFDASGRALVVTPPRAAARDAAESTVGDEVEETTSTQSDFRVPFAQSLLKRLRGDTRDLKKLGAEFDEDAAALERVVRIIGRKFYSAKLLILLIAIATVLAIKFEPQLVAAMRWIVQQFKSHPVHVRDVRVPQQRDDAASEVPPPIAIYAPTIHARWQTSDHVQLMVEPAAVADEKALAAADHFNTSDTLMWIWVISGTAVERTIIRETVGPHCEIFFGGVPKNGTYLRVWCLPRWMTIRSAGHIRVPANAETLIEPDGTVRVIRPVDSEPARPIQRREVDDMKLAEEIRAGDATTYTRTRREGQTDIVDLDGATAVCIWDADAVVQRLHFQGTERVVYLWHVPKTDKYECSAEPLLFIHLGESGYTIEAGILNKALETLPERCFQRIGDIFVGAPSERDWVPPHSWVTEHETKERLSR